MNFLKKYWFSIVIAAIFSILAFLLMPPVIPKINLKLIKTKLASENYFFFYEDVNQDGISEQFTTSYNTEGQAALNGHFLDGRLMNQWNFKGKFTDRHFIRFYDVNDNGNKEVVITSYDTDSLYLSILDPINEIFLLHNHPVLKIIDGEDLTFAMHGFLDLDGNGNKEILMIANAGFKLQPRSITSFEYATLKIQHSPLSGSSFGIKDTEDIDKDGKVEILASSYSTNNYETPIPFTDTASWNIVLDHNLKIAYDPLSYNVPLSVIQGIFYRDANGEATLILLLLDRRNNLAILRKCDLNGNTKIEKTLKSIPGERYFLINDKIYSGIIYLYNPALGYYPITDNLEFVDELKLGSEPCPLVNHRIDIDSDGQVEYLSAFHANGVHFFEDLEEDPLFLQLPVKQGTHNIYISKVSGTDLKYNLYAQADATGFYIQYEKNRLYWMRFIVYLAGFIGLFFLVEFIRWQQKTTIERKNQREKQLIEWQLQAVRNQLDPHFTFNALNAIGAAIYREDKSVAYDYFTKFSRLFRKSLEDGNKLTRSLNSELDFVKSYMLIQQFRFQHIFDFKIEVAHGIDREQVIPKMLIQNLIENAIYHGLLPRKKDGWVNIIVSTDSNHLVITVEDNGIGREASKGKSRSTGKGLKLLQEYFNLLNDKNAKPIHYEIVDLYEDAVASGTRVNVFIPIGFKFY